MPLDAIFLGALVGELDGKLRGLRIDKVQQPERDQLLLSLHRPGASERLLLSAGTGDARVHLTGASFENPASPPMFCMLLRKHIAGARIKSVRSRAWSARSTFRSSASTFWASRARSI
jgi:predicted ribosome quality control (RQC) complex YloA/Tae2 family protein